MSEIFEICANASAHAWSPDRKRLAICPNSEDVLIYADADKPAFKDWKLEHTLKGHDLIVSAIDWSPVHNKIVSCSHDRNAFVWTLTDGTWKPSLSILRINRAALDVKWSPDGQKFAVASGSKVVPICHYESQNDWWISKMIKKHKSTVLGISWHPTSHLIATASSDFRCRVFSAFIPDVDQGTDSIFGATDASGFGELLGEFDASNGWVESCNWSPNGLRLAYVGHDSSLTVVEFDPKNVGGKPDSQTIKEKDLPASKVMFLSDDLLVTAGHMYNPTLYKFQGGSKGWAFLDYCDAKKNGGGGEAKKKESAFGNARNMWANRTTKGQESSSGDSESVWTKHTNTIVSVAPFGDTQWSTAVDAFSTCGMDGKVIIWRIRDLKVRIKALA